MPPARTDSVQRPPHPDGRARQPGSAGRPDAPASLRRPLLAEEETADFISMNPIRNANMKILAILRSFFSGADRRRYLVLGVGFWVLGVGRADLPVSMANTQHPEPKTSTMRHQSWICTQAHGLRLRRSCTLKIRVQFLRPELHRCLPQAGACEAWSAPPAASGISWRSPPPCGCTMEAVLRL